MSLGIDAPRQAAHDGEPGRGQLVGDPVRHGQAVMRRFTRAHDRDAVLVPQAALYVKEERRVRCVPERRGIRRVVDGNDPDPGFPRLYQFLFRILAP